MFLEGDKSVIAAIKEKRQLLEIGKFCSDIKILLVVDGGLMKGAYSTGVGLALEEMGYTDVFDSVVGVSSGAPSAAYFVSKNVSFGNSLIYEECCTSEFLNLRRFWSPLRVNKVISALVDGPKKINWENLKKSDADLYIGVTEFETANPALIKIDEYEKMLKAIEASISIPTLTNNKVIIDGVKYTDGGFSNPHILKHTIETIDATHVLVLTSQDKSVSDIPKFERILNKTLLRHRYSKALLHSVNNRRKARIDFIDCVRDDFKNKQILFVWGDGSVASLERDSGVVKKAVENMCSEWKRVLSL
jgi:predicted patatin/cPLA2 family phospholipase